MTAAEAGDTHTYLLLQPQKVQRGAAGTKPVHVLCHTAALLPLGTNKEVAATAWRSSPRSELFILNKGVILQF